MNAKEATKAWARAVTKLDTIDHIVKQNKELFLDGIDEKILEVIRS